MSLLDSKTGGGGIGNYKGVMLCNRPFGGVSGATKANEVPTKAFGCGVVSEEIGAHVSLASKEKHKIKRPKKESALTKHRKWLAELQQTKDRLEYEYVMEMQNKANTQEKFKRSEKKLRETSRKILRPESTEADAKEAKDEAAWAKSDAKDDASTDSGAAAAAKKKSKKSGKPAWAKTEAKDETEDELAALVGGAGGEEELDDLLDFAKSLDYDKYLGDMEVQTMMAQVKKRIADLERQVSQEEKRHNDSEVDKARREIQMLRDLEKGPQYDAEDFDEADEEEEAREAAKDLRKLDEDIKAVHSTKSAAALVKTAKSAADATPGVPRVTKEPRVAVHDPNEGTRVDDTAKNAVSNLPYMHRNPAI